MNATKADREREIHERARKIQREIGSDLYQVEDYHDIARRLIEQEEELGLPIDPYPLTGDGERKEGEDATGRDRKRRH